MSEHSWVLTGIDPDTRRRAEAEAARLGMSLGDYLAQAMTQPAPTPAQRRPLPEPPASGAAPQKDHLALRVRIEALERRLGLSVSTLDTTVQGIDSTVFDLARRLDQVEMVATDAADNVARATQESTGNFTLVRKRVGDAELALGELRTTQDQMRAELGLWGGDLGRRLDSVERIAHGTAHTTAELGETQAQVRADLDAWTSELDRRVDGVERLAHGAALTAADLTDAQEELKRAVASDFKEFAEGTDERIEAGLAQIRHAAELAAQQSDEALAHVVRDVEDMRSTLENSIARSTNETRARMQAAFSDASDRTSALAEKLATTERTVAKLDEEVRERLSDVADTTQTALDTAVESLRQADADLLAEVQRARGETASISEAWRNDFGTALADLREKFETRSSQNEYAMRQRIDALAARIVQNEELSAEDQRRTLAETHRVEACTIAALEKVVQDVGDGDAALDARLTETESAAKVLRANLDNDLSDLRRRHAEALARLQTLEQIDVRGAAEQVIAPLRARLSAIESTERPLDAEFTERLSRLEAATLNTSAHDALATAQADMLARVAALEGASAETLDRLAGVTRSIGRLASQNADSSAETQERIEKLELGISEGLAENQIIAELQSRIAEMEGRQADAFETLRESISTFVTANERRFDALETSQPGEYDLASEFEALRQRMEERIHGVEQRSVRALEQVAETVSIIERRFHAGDSEAKSA